MPKPEKPEKPTKTKAKACLKAHGHKAEDVDAEPFDDVVKSIVKLHGGTMEAYQGSGLG